MERPYLQNVGHFFPFSSPLISENFHLQAIHGLEDLHKNLLFYFSVTRNNICSHNFLKHMTECHTCIIHFVNLMEIML